MFSSSDLWVGGEHGYHTYRIPALTVAADGSVLAFCEGRRFDPSDGGRKDLLVKRSGDGGRTWSDQAVVHAEPVSSDPNVDLNPPTVGPDGHKRRGDSIGNPTPVVDRRSGRIVMVFIRHITHVLVTHSDDHGLTWSAPRDISDQARPNGVSFVPGPASGIQLRHPSRAGRLVMPSYFRPAGDPTPDGRIPSAIVALMSDDGGQTWRTGAPGPVGGNECQMVELDDGRLMVNMRMQYVGRGRRGVAFSHDGGETWGDFRHEEAQPDPICQGSLIRLEAAGKPDQLLFANLADPARIDPAKPGVVTTGDRHRLTARLSEDGGETWPVDRLIEPGLTGYSALAELPDGAMLCLYETGEKVYREKLRIARFDLPWLQGA